MYRNVTRLMIASFKPKKNIHTLECASFFRYEHEHHFAPTTEFLMSLAQNLLLLTSLKSKSANLRLTVSSSLLVQHVGETCRVSSP